MPTPPPTSSRLPIIAALCACAAFFLVLLCPLAFVDLDVFHEMALVRYLLQNGHFPLHDPFAYTPTVSPLVHHEWLTGLVLYAVATTCGPTGFLLFKYLLTAAIAWLAVHLARRAGSSWPVLCLLIPLGLLVGIIGFGTIRAQLFTLLFTALLLILLHRDRCRPTRWLLLLLPLYVLWLNFHAGFIIAPVFLAAHWLEQVLRTRRLQPHLLALLLAMIPLVLLNPYGFAYPHFLAHALTMPRPGIIEWRPLWTHWEPFPLFHLLLHYPDPMLLSFGTSLLPVAYCLYRLTPRRLPGLLILLLAALAALLHTRHLSIYGLVFITTVPAWLTLTPLGAQFARFFRRFGYVITIAAIVFGLGCLAITLPRNPFRLHMPATPHDLAIGYPVVYPSGPVNYLRAQHFRGNLLTPFRLGAYISWNLYPNVRVGLDSRYEVAYQPGVPEEIFAFYDADPATATASWHAVLQKYPPDLVLVPAHTGLVKLMAQTPWPCVYRDDCHLLFANPNLLPPLPFVDRTGQPLSASFP